MPGADEEADRAAALRLAGVGAAELQSGRLPEAGRTEVLAGAKIEPRETLNVGGQSLKVVGVLRPGLALFDRSFLVPPDDATNVLFPAAVPSVLHAWLVRASAEELRDEKVRKPLANDLSAREIRLGHLPGTASTSDVYYRYLSGPGDFPPGRLRRVDRTLSLAGEQGRIARSCRVASQGKPTANRSGDRQSRPALSSRYGDRSGDDGQTSADYQGVHLAYFGLGRSPASLFIYAAGGHGTGRFSWAEVDEAAQRRTAILWASRARRYLEVEVSPAPAAVTLGSNFLLGSLACITLPSVLLPGSGVFLACIRAGVGLDPRAGDACRLASRPAPCCRTP